MKSMNRQFGKMMRKGGGNTANVSVLLSDYEDADKTLTKIIEASKAWRDAWVSILSIQVTVTTNFEELYNPIVGATDGHGQEHVETPQLQQERTQKLKKAFEELKADLLEEVTMMEARVIRPATDAKDYIQPIRKTIKKRENKRLDWEKYLDRVNNYERKPKRSDRENAALEKSKQEEAQAAEVVLQPEAENEFRVADDRLRETLPPIITAAFSILPHLIAVQIMIQNTLLAQYYTVLHNYCEENGFPSPPPPMNEVISSWEQDFKPTQQTVERINCIARGKAIHAPMALGDEGGKTSSVTGLNIRSGIANRRAGSSQNINNVGNENAVSRPDPRVMRIPSSTSVSIVSPRDRTPSPDPAYAPPEYPSSNHLTPVSSYSAHSPAGPSADYFQRGAVQKKKPPPPPPKRIGSQNAGVFAVALYAFEGQNDGDLAFREGDQIKIIKKTDSTDDWWEGELRGQRGSFPANYCKIN